MLTRAHTKSRARCTQVDTKVMKLFHQEGFQRDLLEDHSHELRMSPSDKAFVEEGKRYVRNMTVVTVIVLPWSAQALAPEWAFDYSFPLLGTTLLGTGYFAIVTGLLVITMIFAELRSTPPRAPGDKAWRNLRCVRWLLVLLRWVVAGGVWAVVLFGGMLQML